MVSLKLRTGAYGEHFSEGSAADSLLHTCLLAVVFEGSVETVNTCITSPKLVGENNGVRL